MTIGTAAGAVPGPLCIGNENRNNAGEQFLGASTKSASAVWPAARGRCNFSQPLVTITANPISQNVDYNQPVNFTVGASSQFSFGYQWRFNSNNTSRMPPTVVYNIANVAASDAGFYDCIVTNTAGFSATSTEAHLVVGAANFIANRYSFKTDTTDSIGGQTGTNFGNATVSGGKLVLDGTTGTYMQLPASLFNSANATALTVEFWATYGSNPNNVYPFSFGYTNFVTGSRCGRNQLCHLLAAQCGPSNALSPPSDPSFAQTGFRSGKSRRARRGTLPA